jgi:NAD(P)-dependent dehydrogenase (short-subunit alcohol dehydrogenase family)
VNYLAHFALTARLLPLMAGLTDARVVTVISLAHRQGVVDLERLDGRGRRPFELYSQSKMALAMFGLELDRRFRTTGSSIKSVLAHPGFASSNLTRGMAPGLSKFWLSLVFPLGQDPVSSARSTLRAALGGDVASGAFYGPGGRGELKGPPVPVQLDPRALDEDKSRRLWELSEQLSGQRMGN